jgi:hypothetical protein
MQPAQLSLLPDLVPAPPPSLTAQLPEPELAAAVALLARLIARARASAQPSRTEENADE